MENEEKKTNESKGHIPLIECFGESQSDDSSKKNKLEAPEYVKEFIKEKNRRHSIVLNENDKMPSFDIKVILLSMIFFTLFWAVWKLL